ncbi:hypothetical protein BDV95DRAFT_563211 [Massariosphaeria phaeospora]|uniref:Structure-specific endonuclease subunit SLX4 n=1 Tax=Massariosphaeria phaeospora TaxID=100035 RepID=A0A7C8IG58_9PLEO|nr:hypothetical protein BDV95DRAFT_563211 [Massariosphaeria phaeospora]
MAGRTFEIVVLSSSPPPGAVSSPPNTPPASRRRVPLASLLPQSPLQLRGATRMTAGTLKSGSRAAAIPEKALRGFATAGELVRSQHLDARPDNDMRDEQSLAAPSEAPGAKAKKGRKPAPKLAADGEGEPPKKKARARKPKANKDGSVQGATTSTYFTEPIHIAPTEPAAESAAPTPAPQPKPAKTRKSRAKKTESAGGETQTTLKKAKITKPRGATKQTSKSRVKDADILSSHFGDGNASAIGTKADARRVDGRNEDDSIWEVPESPQRKEMDAPCLDLEEAVARRRDWTPTRDTGLSAATLPDLANTTDNPPAVAVDKGEFTSMVSGFAYPDAESGPASLAAAKVDNPESAATTTRRKVDLVVVPGNELVLHNPSPDKAKVSKKKVRTITDLVTGQYANQSADPSPPVPTTDFFSPRKTTTKVALNDVPAPDTTKTSSKPRKPRKPSSTKAASNKGEPRPKSKKAPVKAAAKPKMVADKLLSPSAALLKLSRQDILFGTSSQLALDESPTMVRQIQQALHESELDAQSLAGYDYDTTKGSQPWSRLAKLKGKKALWAASSRDEDGQLLDKSDIYIPEPDRTRDLPLLMDGPKDVSDVPLTMDGASDVHDLPPILNGTTDAPDSRRMSFAHIDDFEAPVISISSDLPTPPPGASRCSPGRQLRSSIEDEVTFHNIDDYSEPPPSNQNVDSTMMDIDDPTSHYQRSSRPPSTLDSIIGDIGSLSPKYRPARPSTSHFAAPPNRAVPWGKEKKTTIPVSSLLCTTEVTKPEGRFKGVVEIPDSEDDEPLILSPPRKRARLDAPEPQATLTPSAEAASKPEPTRVYRLPSYHLDWNAIKPSIFEKMYTAIRLLELSTDQATPTFYQQIVEMEPLNLEDITTFVNTKTSIRTFKRATQLQVKAWNRVLKARGEEKLVVEEGGDDVLAVEKELEVAQMQDVLQVNSIASISKAPWGRGDGVRKGFY